MFYFREDYPNCAPGECIITYDGGKTIILKDVVITDVDLGPDAPEQPLPSFKKCVIQFQLKPIAPKSA